MLKLIYVCLLIDLFLISCFCLSMLLRGVRCGHKVKAFLPFVLLYAFSGSFLIATIKPGVFDDVSVGQITTSIIINIVVLLVILINISEMFKTREYLNLNVDELVTEYIIVANLPSIGKLNTVVYNTKNECYYFYGEYGKLEIDSNKPQKAWVYENGKIIGSCNGAGFTDHAKLGKLLILKMFKDNYPYTIK